MLYYFDKYARQALIISVTRTRISNIIVREELQDEYQHLEKHLFYSGFIRISFANLVYDRSLAY